MARHVRLREFLVGVEGLALLRGLFTGSDESAHQRITEVRRVVGDGEAGTFAVGADVPELDVTEGYARWSTTYHKPGNPLVSAEQQAVWALIDGLSPGQALDVEPRFGHAEVEMQQPAAALVPEATEAAYRDLPAALVWDLAKDA